jgi:hypothetical protein
MQASLKDPVRNVNPEFLGGLTLESTKIYTLPGGLGPRINNQVDPRLKNLPGTPVGDVVPYYEHIATVRHVPTNKFFVAFRETGDALLSRQQDLTKYPEWLMKDPRKQAERNIHVYMVVKHPLNVKVMNSLEDWLAHLADDSIFESIVYFLGKQGVFSTDMLKSI